MAGNGPMKEAWIKAGDLPLYTRILGDRSAGAPVVLVHGIGVAGRLMLPLGERLSASRQVYVPDLPGFGKSPGPRRALGVPGLAGCLAAWARSAGLRRAAFLGNSFGCQVAVELAVRHPGLAYRLVLQAPTMDPAARSCVRQVARWLKDLPGERASQAPLSLADYRSCGLRRLLATFRCALRDPIEEKLPRVRAPVLVVRGAADPIVPRRWAERAAGLPPNGRLLTLSGAPHALVYARPDELARAILPFLRE